MSETRLEKFATLVKQMREAQKTYFRERSPQALSTSKELERRVDRAVREIFDTQGKLFQE